MKKWLVVALVAIVSLVPVVGARGDATVTHQQTLRGLRVAPGFQATPWASVPVPTNLEWAPDGALYVASMDGSVYRVDPSADELGGAPTAVVTGLTQPLGLAAVAEGDGVRLYVSDSYEQDGKTFGTVLTVGPGETEPATVVKGLPNGRHNTNDMTIGPDGLLYIGNGNGTDDGLECGPAVPPGGSEACSNPDEVEVQPLSGSLLRVDPTARDLVADPSMVVATGMRNVYDVAFRPGTTEAWVPMNGPDSPAADDILYKIETAPAVESAPDQPGRRDDAPGRNKRHDAEPPAPAGPLHLGFPSCLYNAHENTEVGSVGSHHAHGAGLVPMDNLNDAVIAQFGRCPVDTVQRPVATFGGHVSANGIAFAHGSAFPGTYANDVFVAEWGNLWGTEDGHVSGHKIVRVNLRDDGTVVEIAHDDGGHEHDDGHMHAAHDGEEHDDAQPHHRAPVTEFATGGLPIDVAFGPHDGALYVADMAGLIHRIAWTDDSVTPPDDENPTAHDHGEHEYENVDCPGNSEQAQLFEERQHHGNGRTECVLVDGDVIYFCGNAQGDCYIAYDPYQQDTVDGNSAHDRGPALRYHNGDINTVDHHHGHGSGCWENTPTPTMTPGEADAAGKAAIQRELNAELQAYTGQLGMTNALADGWYAYPVPESKQFHMIRQFWAGDRFPDQPKAMWAPNIESFVLAMTDDGWQVMNGMFMLGNDGPDDAPLNDTVHMPDGSTRTYYATGEYDYKWLSMEDEALLPLWRDPTPGSTLVCDLSWHGHVGGEGAATSFDAEYPDVSPWMAHVGLYAADGDPFAENRGYDSSEPHAYWEPWRHVPALCNPNGPCE